MTEHVNCVGDGIEGPLGKANNEIFKGVILDALVRKQGIVRDGLVALAGYRRRSGKRDAGEETRLTGGAGRVRNAGS